MTNAEEYLNAQDPQKNSTLSVVPDKDALVKDYGQTLFLFKDGTMITGNREYTAFTSHNLSEKVKSAEFYKNDDGNVNLKYSITGENYNINFNDVNLDSSKLKQIEKDTGLPLEGLKEIQGAELSFKDHLLNLRNDFTNKLRKTLKNI